MNGNNEWYLKGKRKKLDGNDEGNTRGSGRREREQGGKTEKEEQQDEESQ